MLVVLAAARALHPSTPPAATILVFDGAGVSSNGARAVEDILTTAHLDYATADSAQLNAMSDTQLRAYRLLIVPGGNFLDMGNSLTEATAAKLRSAVENGTNYFGICAGAFLAGYFPPPYRAFDLTAGVKFHFYPLVGRKAVVRIASPDGRTLDQYLENGPQLSGWGTVVARYPDGTPAIAEGMFGRGHVLLSGVHPEAPEVWRRGLTFTTTVDEDRAYTEKLIDAALHGQDLPHY